MSADQDYVQGLRILDNALWRIAHHSDCEYGDVKDRPKPCNCPRCIALSALEAAKSWRFHGALSERVHNGQGVREEKMHRSWVKCASSQGPDHLLSQILQESQAPSARDWYVATSVIQWLATNVGMAVLEGAGFAYQQWEQDRASRELSLRDQAREDAAHKSEAAP